MIFTDTHTHLYDEQFRDDACAAVERAVRAGVTRMVFPDIDSTSRQAMNDLAGKYPGNIYTCLGLHPTSVGPGWEEELEKIESLAGPGICAIGETGMDCYWSREFVREQEAAFERQVRLACRLGLPVIIHAREATELILNVLERCKALSPRGVFHAFTGSRETFARIMKLGDWYVGIGGVVTFRNASIAETVKDIPLDRMVLETDAPYLAPVPHRGQRNETAFVKDTLLKLADILGEQPEYVAETTSANALKMFGQES